MIKRIFDATRFNELANDTDIKALIAPYGTGELDLQPLLDNPLNVAIGNDDGGFVATKLETGVYEVHTLFHPQHASRAGVIARAGIRWMFERTDCFELQTKVPLPNEHALAFSYSNNFTHWFTRKSVWQFAVDRAVSVDYLYLTWNHWLDCDSAHYHKIGREWHDQLFSHPEDYSHYCVVGASVQMVKGGQPEKAIQLYNRWARLAGYECIYRTCLDPLCIVMGDTAICVDGEEFQVMGKRAAEALQEAS